MRVYVNDAFSYGFIWKAASTTGSVIIVIMH